MRLTCCMMVKNEEHNLKRCLESVKNLVDEIIIVDTGSTDNTIAIAKEFGAKVYEHPWEDNFSKHRNQSIEYATGDWLFILDADEEVVLNVSIEKFREIIAKVEADGFVSIAVEFSDIQKGVCAMNFNSHRLFKKGHISYKGIVHNKTVINGDSIAVMEIGINHYGYDLDEEKTKAKYERSKKLLLKRISEDENDLEAYFYMSQLESVMKDLKKTLEYATLYIEKSKELGAEVRSTVHFTAYRACYTLQLWDEAKVFLLDRIENLHHECPDIDIAYAFVELGMQMQDYEMIEKGAEKYLSIYEAVEAKRTVLPGFTFTYNANALVFVLYANIMISVYAAVNHLKSFDAIKSLVNETYFKELKDNLNLNMKGFGLPRIEDILRKCQM